MKFGLTDRQVSQIREILAQCPAITQAVVFGSRAMGNFRDTSDMDIALKGDINLSVLAHVKYTLEEETCLPYFFDVIGYYAILKIGALVVNLNPLSVEREILYLLNHAEARTVLVAEPLYPRIAAIFSHLFLFVIVPFV